MWDGKLISVSFPVFGGVVAIVCVALIGADVWKGQSAIMIYFFSTGISYTTFILNALFTWQESSDDKENERVSKK